MKKLLICGILALLVAGVSFAQWPDGLSFSGEFKTGFRADFFGGAFGDSTMQLAGEEGKLMSQLFANDHNNDGLVDNSNYVEDVNDRAVTSVWNDDAGNRFRLGFNYTQPGDRNFGFRGYVNFPKGDSAGLDTAWGWFNLFDGKVQVSAGWVDDGRWASPSPEDISFSNPRGGFRIEAMPIDGLSVGWVVRNDGNGVNSNTNPIYNGEGTSMTLRDFFGASSFGASYEMPDFLKVSAGLELRPDGSDRRGKGFGFGGRSDVLASQDLDKEDKGMTVFQGGTKLAFGNFGGPDADNGKVRTGDLGISAYLGAQVKPIDPLTVQLGFVFANVDNIGKKTVSVYDEATDTSTDQEVFGSGYMHLNQKVAYAINGGLTARVTAHEVFDLSGYDKFLGTDDNVANKIAEGKGEAKPNDAGKLPIYLEFVPGVDYTILDNLSGYTEVGVKLYGELFEIAPKTGATFRFGSGYELGAYYQLFLDGNSADLFKDAKAPIRNVVQVNFAWWF